MTEESRRDMIAPEARARAPLDDFAEIWRSRRVWSLWDMLELNAEDFYRAAIRLAEMKAWLHSHENDNNSIYLSARELENEDKRFVINHLTDLATHLDVLGARVTGMTVADALKYCHGAGATWGGSKTLIGEIQNTLRRELRLAKLLTLDAKDQSYLEPDGPLFGEEVDAKFHSLAYEIVEIGKCLAFQRSTAAVFHSIRCLEAGIRAISSCLGIPSPTKGVDRSWGNMLQVIKADIDRRWPPNTPGRLSQDARLFEKIHAALHAMMNPYRNDTMHLAAKYTEEEAHHLFEVVKGFMATVASRCDENGEPFVMSESIESRAPNPEVPDLTEGQSPPKRVLFAPSRLPQFHEALARTQDGIPKQRKANRLKALRHFLWRSRP